MEEEVGTKHKEAPRFGDAESNKEEVYAFYKHWETFATNKQFAYVDPYDPRQAPNRRVKRLIEAENQKERNKERNRFNAKVRELIAHIRQKDSRMQRYTQEDIMVKRAKQAEIEAAREAKRSAEAERLRKYREDLAKQNAKAEAEGDFEEVFVE